MIGVNFTNAAVLPVLAPGDSAGVAPFAQTNWNNVSAPAISLALNDNSGGATTALLTTTGASFSGITSAVAGADELLNSGRAVGGGGWSFTLANIPYASYSLIVYDQEFNTGAVIGITAAGTTYYTSSPQFDAAGYLDNNLATPYTYTQGTSTDAMNPTPVSNYVLFSGLSGASQTVQIAGASGTRVGGFQIVETSAVVGGPAVPEPTTALFGLALVGAVGLSRRRAARA